MKVKINEPCHEDWDAMKIGLISRHCDVCEKNVMDFTEMNRGEIITYLLKNPNGSTCGRMRSDQFDFKHEDIPILIEALRKHRPSNAFMILALVSLSLASCSTDPSAQIKTPPVIEHPMDVVEEPHQDTTNCVTGQMKVEDTSTVEQTQQIPAPVPNPVPPPPPVGLIELGEVIVDPEPPIYPPEPEPEMPIQEDEQIYQFADQMPEFPGGVDSLIQFIKTHLNYPKEAQDAGMEGNVYVRFVVEKDGSISSKEVLRSFYGPCDQEAIRVIDLMPKWNPGVINGREVRTYMTLPFRFKMH